MRQITEDAARAFEADCAFKSGNTEVRVEQLGNTYLLLHGNVIATRFTESGNVVFTLAGWGTATTRERVNGLLNVMGYPTRVIQNKDVQYLFHMGQSKQIDAHDRWFINKDYEVEVL